MVIVFYDISSVLPQKTFSPNTWKTRYCLNYKHLPYRTEWLEFTEIEETCKKLGVGPTGKNSDGSPSYTLPMIYDPSTGTAVAESFAIAEYLEKTYPTHSLFPDNTVALQSSFDEALRNIALRPLFKLALFDVYTILNPESQPYFRSTRETAVKQPLEQLAPTGSDAQAEWEKVKAGFGVVDSWLTKTEGPFLMGNTASWADLVLGAWLTWLKTIEHRKWDEIGQWHDGRWIQVLQELQEFTAIV